MTKKNDEGFLNRWSQRKRESVTDQPDAADDTLSLNDAGLLDDKLLGNSETDLTSAEVSKDALANIPDQSILTDEDMPDIETLSGDSDFSPFLSEGVSKELRNRALKKLFFSGKFSARDGLDDYDDDFTYFEPLGDTVTSDMKFHQRRKEKIRLAELEEREAEERARLEAEAPESETHEPETSESETPETSESELAELDGEEGREPAVQDTASESDEHHAEKLQHADSQQTPDEVGRTQEDAPPVA